MRDLRDPGWIIAKGFLFLLLGVTAAGLLVFERPELKTIVLLAIAVWSFCRFYYFGFYVLERYVDPEYRFSGMGSMLRYVFLRWRRQKEEKI